MPKFLVDVIEVRTTSIVVDAPELNAARDVAYAQVKKEPPDFQAADVKVQHYAASAYEIE